MCDNNVSLENISAHIQITNSTIGYIAEFKVQYQAAFFCARCLEPSSREYAGHLSLTYIHGADPYDKAEKVDLKKSDLNRIYYTGSHIDLSVGIREAVILSYPLVALCKDACLGLCPVCGTNRNKTTCECSPVESGIFTPVVDDTKTQKGIKRKGKKR